MKRGCFITLEGLDGSGKSTQQRLLVAHLRGLGYRVRSTREPGGTHVGERIRDILMEHRGRAPSPLAELALMYAARAQHLEETVRPALARGECVVSDRFNDASFAYQGYGRKLGVSMVRAFDRIVCGGTQPDLTLLLDLDPRPALKRARGRESRARSSRARFEAEGLAFHRRVRKGYLDLARRNRTRIKIVRAGRSVHEVQKNIRDIVGAYLARRTKIIRQKSQIMN